MAYCRNCGNEIPEEVKFCTNCGSAVDSFANEARSNEFNRTNQNDDVISKKNSKRKVKREETGYEKFSKFFGVILLFIAIVDYNSDPPILTIILSLAIIVGAIFCLSQKYRLKGFTIIALVLAIFCLFAGISQGKKLGFLKTPTDKEYAEAGYIVEDKDDAPEIQIDTTNNNVGNSNDVSSDEKKPEAAKETKKKIVLIEIYEINDVANIVISNTCKENKVLLNRYDKGVSTKGKGRGNGLYFAKKMLTKNTWIEESQEIIDGYYIETLKITKKRKSK